MRMRVILLALPISLILILTLTLSAHAQDQFRVAWIRITGYISLATLEFVNIALHGDINRYDALLITLDTLGGDASSTLKIIKLIQQSDKPVLCLVYPEGAEAMSAGTLILISCHVSGMSPNTLIGACQPVVGGVPTNDTKIINFLVEKMETITRARGK